MYLDPEGISRQTRWASERAGALDWNAIAASVDAHIPRDLLAPALRAFGEQLEAVEPVMREQGVDDAIIDARRMGIATVSRGLREVEG